MKWDEEKLRTYSEMRKSGATAEEIAAMKEGEGRC